MNEKLTELDGLSQELERLLARLEQLADAEQDGDDVAELWLRARFRCAITLDEHLHLLKATAEEQAANDATNGGSAVEELRKLAAYDHGCTRLSTFTKVEMGEEVEALTTIHSTLEKKSADNTNTKGESE